MRLYAFYPSGHGPQSFFVMAESEESARAAIQARVDAKNDAARQRSRERGWMHWEKATEYEYADWPTGYSMEVLAPGEVAENENM